MIEFRLPSLGADMEQGKLLEWKVAPGQNVARGDVVAVVDTSKAAVDVEIWEAGTIQELIGQPGKIYPVGALIARLLAPGEVPGAAAPSVAAPTPAAAARQRVSPAARSWVSPSRRSREPGRRVRSRCRTSMQRPRSRRRRLVPWATGRRRCSAPKRNAPTCSALWRPP
jgi:pyruvate dehydrogenase E2 component (dihydrolipoamide acetyltransferase)